jgi:hypothetical protein
MTSWLSIMEKINTFPIEMIHIMPECIMHLHGHRNKMLPLMKPFILVDLSNGVTYLPTYILTYLTNYLLTDLTY